MDTRDFELHLTTEADAQPIRNLWPLYLHDISEHDGNVPNAHGIFTLNEEIQSLADEEYTPGRPWWKTPELLWPYLGTVGGRPAGFNLIASGPYVPTAGVDFIVHEFFLAKPYRGTGAAVQLAQQGIERHPGAWEVVTYPSSQQAIKFWRRALPGCAVNGEVVETEEKEHPFGHKIVFRFQVGDPT